MSKQDRQGVRTINDLEGKYYFDRAFAEVMGVATNAQKSAESAQNAADKYANDIKGELKLVVKRDENDQIVSMLNASANTITIKGNRVSIESDNFTLAENGTIKATNADIKGKVTATSGELNNCTINETCVIKGVLTGNTLSTFTTSKGAQGSITFQETTLGGYYWLRLDSSDLLETGIILGENGANPETTIYSEYATLKVGEGVDINTMADFTVTANRAVICGVNIKELAEKVAALEGA